MSKGTEFVEDYMKKLHTDKSNSPETHGPSKGAKFIEEYMRRLNAKKAKVDAQAEKSFAETELIPQAKKLSETVEITPPAELIPQPENLSESEIEEIVPKEEVTLQAEKSSEKTEVIPQVEKPSEKTEIAPKTDNLSLAEEIVHQNDDEKAPKGIEIPEYLKEMLGVDEEQEKYGENENFHTLKVSSLYKSFGRKNVIKGIDIQMHTGEILGLLGPNGAGKTTTFYMIVGFIKPTKGEVFMDGTKITHLPMYKRAKLGISYLPQEPSVFKKLTVEENIWAILETRKDLTYHQKKQALENLIEEFSIGRIRKQPAFTLSGGERRRTEIARSLAIEPKFLLLDEPFAGIDPIAIADIKKVINQLAKRDIGLLITDHNVRDTLEITNRAIIINNGVIMMQGTRQAILESPSAREVYLGKDFSM